MSDYVHEVDDASVQTCGQESVSSSTSSMHAPAVGLGRAESNKARAG